MLIVKYLRSRPLGSSETGIRIVPHPQSIPRGSSRSNRELLGLSYSLINNGRQECCAGERIDPEARGFVCAVKRANGSADNMRAGGSYSPQKRPKTSPHHTIAATPTITLGPCASPHDVLDFAASLDRYGRIPVAVGMRARSASLLTYGAPRPGRPSTAPRVISTPSFCSLSSRGTLLPSQRAFNQ